MKAKQKITKPKGEWFDALVEEIEASITESNFTSSEVLIVSKHGIGESITDASEREEVKESELAALIAKRTGVTKRTIQQCVQFYRFDPKLDCLKQGKNISWRKILAQFQKPKEKEKQVVIEHIWFGKVLSECSKKELIEAVRHLVKELKGDKDSYELDKIKG